MSAAAPIALGLQVVSQLAGASAEASALRHNSAVDAENARLAELGGALRGEAIRREERRISGEALARQGESGVQVGTGSALEILRQNAIEREYDVLAARYSAAGEANALRDQASAKRRAAEGALLRGVLGAGAAALTGISDIRNTQALARATSAYRAATVPGGSAMPIPGMGGG